MRPVQHVGSVAAQKNAATGNADVFNAAIEIIVETTWLQVAWHLMAEVDATVRLLVARHLIVLVYCHLMAV